MTFKTRIVLLFAALRKPIDPKNGVNIHAMRKHSEKAARLGSKLFDKKVPLERF
jgi:hypothetical protein